MYTNFARSTRSLQRQGVPMPRTLLGRRLKSPDLAHEHPLVLVVDDDASVRHVIGATLEKADFAVIEADDGAKALGMVNRFQPDVVLMDIMMPKMDGFRACAELRQSPGGEYIPILMMTGRDDTDCINRAYEAGATDFIAKPFNWTIFSHRVRYMVRAGRTLAKLQESESRLAHAQRIAQLGYWQWYLPNDKLIWSDEIQRIFGLDPQEDSISYQTFITASHPDDKELIAKTLAAALTEGRSFNIDYRIMRPDASERIVHLQGQAVLGEAGQIIQVIGTAQDITERKQAEYLIKESVKRFQVILEGTVCALSSAVEIRDPYTAGHQKLVAQLAGAVASEIGLPESQIKGIKVIGALHDIGKISVPTEILCKPGLITATEFSMIRNHSQVGYDVLKEIKFPWPVALAVLQHHERMDGSGYPQGLEGAAILPEARIIAVADVVEAMVHHRPYRPAHSLDEALEEITQHRNIKYDPAVVDACARVFEKGFKFD
jgi:putative nucleotidyltransferase with HDIG domain/PAS domain S-box-containing protein